MARIIKVRGLSLLLALLLSGGVVACNNVLDVSLPGNVTDADLNSPSMAPSLVNGAIADFECAFSKYIMNVAVWADEFQDASTWQPVGSWETRRPDAVDGGTAQCPTELFRGNGTFGPYLSLQIARGQARNAYALIDGFGTVANKAALQAQASAFEGYATLILGEAYCQMRLDGAGALLTPLQVFQAAEPLFARAMTLAQSAGASSTPVLNLARVGRARTLKRMGQLAQAATHAAAVPAGYVYNATYSATPTRRNNWVAAYNNINLFVSVDSSFRNRMIGTTPDSRVPVSFQASPRANDSNTPMWLQQLFPTLASPIPIATYQEARLIIAEAEAEAGNTGPATAAINQVRAMYSLPAYAGGTQAEILTQIREERRRTLFLQSHRLGDMLQYGIPLHSGTDPKGRPYVNAQQCLPLPNAEL